MLPQQTPDSVFYGRRPAGAGPPPPAGGPPTSNPPSYTIIHGFRFPNEPSTRPDLPLGGQPPSNPPSYTMNNGFRFLDPSARPEPSLGGQPTSNPPSYTMNNGFRIPDSFARPNLPLGGQPTSNPPTCTVVNDFRIPDSSARPDLPLGRQPTSNPPTHTVVNDFRIRDSSARPDPSLGGQPTSNITPDAMTKGFRKIAPRPPAGLPLIGLPNHNGHGYVGADPPTFSAPASLPQRVQQAQFVRLIADNGPQPIASFERGEVDDVVAVFCLQRLACLRPGLVHVIDPDTVATMVGFDSSQPNNPWREVPPLNAEQSRRKDAMCLQIGSMLFSPIRFGSHLILVVFKLQRTATGQREWKACVYDPLLYLHIFKMENGRFQPHVYYKNLLLQVLEPTFKFLRMFGPAGCSDAVDTAHMVCPQQAPGHAECGVAVCLNAMRVLAGVVDPVEEPEADFNVCGQGDPALFQNFTRARPSLGFGDAPTCALYWSIGRWIMAELCQSAFLHGLNAATPAGVSAGRDYERVRGALRGVVQHSAGRQPNHPSLTDAVTLLGPLHALALDLEFNLGQGYPSNHTQSARLAAQWHEPEVTASLCREIDGLLKTLGTDGPSVSAQRLLDFEKANGF